METKRSYLTGEDLAAWEQAWAEQMRQRIEPIYRNQTQEDIIDKFCSVSRAAKKVFITLKNKCSWAYNIAHLPELESLTENQMKVFRRHIAILKKADLVTRIKKTNIPESVKVTQYTYMINPAYLKCREYTAANALWNLNK